MRNKNPGKLNNFSYFQDFYYFFYIIKIQSSTKFKFWRLYFQSTKNWNPCQINWHQIVFRCLLSWTIHVSNWMRNSLCGTISWWTCLKILGQRLTYSGTSCWNTKIQFWLTSSSILLPGSKWASHPSKRLVPPLMRGSFVERAQIDRETMIVVELRKIDPTQQPEEFKQLVEQVFTMYRHELDENKMKKRRWTDQDILVIEFYRSIDIERKLMYFVFSVTYSYINLFDSLWRQWLFIKALYLHLTLLCWTGHFLQRKMISAMGNQTF